MLAVVEPEMAVESSADRALRSCDTKPAAEIVAKQKAGVRSAQRAKAVNDDKRVRIVERGNLRIAPVGRHRLWRSTTRLPWLNFH